MTVELVRPSVPWHRNPTELAALWRWMDEQGRAPDDPAYFMEKGIRWSPEHEEMLREEEMDRLLEQDQRDLQRRSSL